MGPCRSDNLHRHVLDDHLPPLGLLSVGRPLIDDGHIVSIIVRGEGEETMRRLPCTLATGRLLATVPGIACRDGDGEILATQPAQAIG
ncbi:hypothetical protein ACC846_38045, partial [Rhizobium ruizarguesonis]